MSNLADTNKNSNLNIQKERKERNEKKRFNFGLSGPLSVVSSFSPKRKKVESHWRHRVEKIIIIPKHQNSKFLVFCPFNPKRDRRLIRRLFSRFFWSFLYQQIFYTQRQDNASYKNRLVGKNKADTQKKKISTEIKGNYYYYDTIIKNDFTTKYSFFRLNS